MVYLNGSEDFTTFVYSPDKANTLNHLKRFDDGSVIWYVDKKYPYATIEKRGRGGDYSMFVWYDPFRFDNSIATTKWGAKHWVKRALKRDKAPAIRPQTRRQPPVTEKITMTRDDF